MTAIIQRLIAIVMSILAFFGIGKTAPETPAEDLYQVEDGAVTFCLDANATTGYAWTAALEGDCVALTEDRYEADAVEPPVAGRGGKQYYTFTAVKAGDAVITFTYARAWENEEDPLTYVAAVRVDKDLNVKVLSFDKI